MLLEPPVSYVMGTELEEDRFSEVEVEEEEMMNVEKESIAVSVWDGRVLRRTRRVTD